jgi:hypothetical protein
VLCGVALLIDSASRYRFARKSGFRGVSDWKGLLPYPAIAILGAISSIQIGWVGVALAVIAGVVSSETFKVESPPDVRKVSHLTQHTVILQIGILFLFELLTAALCLRDIVATVGSFLP